MNPEIRWVVQLLILIPEPNWVVRTIDQYSNNYINHVVECQSLPTTELNSAIWIIRQYSCNIGQDQTSICSSLYFTCSTGTPTPHITKIVMLSYPTTAVAGLPNSGLSQFNFPELEELDIIAMQAVVADINILDLIMGSSPKLQRLRLRSDPKVTLLPSGFWSSLPMLSYFSVEGAMFQQYLVFNFGPTITELTFGITGALIVDQSTPVHTKLTKLNINAKLLAIPQTFAFTNQSFPALTTLTITPVLGSQPLALHCNASSITSLTVASQVEVHINLLYPQSLISLFASGYSTLSPPLINFTNLLSLELSQSTLSSLQLTKYPDSLALIDVSETNLVAFPNIPVNNLKSVTYDKNQLQGAIPWNNFQNANNILLDVSFNTGLTTIVPESFCNNRLYIDGCPLITDLPECFKCYQNNRFYVRTDIVLDPGFTCNITFNSTMLYTVFGQAALYGTNIGYGSFDNRYLLVAEIPNKQLIFADSLIEVGPPRNITLVMDGHYPEYKFNFTVLEVGIKIPAHLGVYYEQIPPGIVQFHVFVEVINPYLQHNITINDNINCLITGVVSKGNYLYCNVTGHSFKQGDNLKYTITNPYYIVHEYLTISSFYPTDVSLNFYDSIISVGSRYGFIGNYGNGPMNQTIIYFNGDPSICIVTLKSFTNIQCNQTKYWQGGETNITISVDGFMSTPIIVDLTSLESLCNDTGCSGHGTCNQNGNCICDTGYYSDTCSEKYPTFSSGEYDENDRKLISIYGDFGPFNQTIVSITLNSTDCQATYKSQSLINCTLVSEPTDGLALVRLTVDNSTNNGNNWIYFKPSSQSSGSGSDSDGSGGELTCPFNCYGHGQCINGKCKCDTGYSSIDNCLTKTTNHTITPNTTSPTTSFDIDGIDFQFEMIAIQEIDTDDNIINQVLTNSWISTILIDSQTQTTTVNYQLNNSDTITTTALVTATISFSQQPRDIQFGSQQLHIDANSIKLSVNISNWTFNTFLTTLRVIFKTTINNDQSIEFDCQDVNIDTLSYDQLSNNIQYLRVVKDNIQFTGRFIDYVLSDGRPTFSRTSIVNKTASLDDQQSALLIGISMPQSSESILDPDFTPLLIDKSADSGCDSKSNTWRIIVGVVVGVAGAVAIGVASIILIKKKNTAKRFNNDMQYKLDRINN
ncbi:EGF-like domain-containing protein [Cavenderia fasciculata]|uniref:EGF-like domain-containing protein n=1 Tax=Cavenderia fasciculata TaxID=261658 RepID=F4Q7Y4_CACFS|nr:EGF-like domain-containing protein [Cavenderia fasciculata]EGG15884.1 EGF-like domain-containing protein [Cavenderia fasciculata]|eukprot:XP_004352209.1 EGF-like domain-containing protein [Cavenderia fasciculata]